MSRITAVLQEALRNEREDVPRKPPAVERNPATLLAAQLKLSEEIAVLESLLARARLEAKGLEQLLLTEKLVRQAEGLSAARKGRADALRKPPATERNPAALAAQGPVLPESKVVSKELNTAPLIDQPNAAVGELRPRLETARSEFTANLYAQNTQRGYRYDWEAFVRWCRRMEMPSLPTSADALTLHVTDMLTRGRKVTTAAHRVAAVVHKHLGADLPSPLTREVRELLRGARRTRLDQKRQVAPLLIEHLRNISGLLADDGTPIALRNRAILVVGFASALRSANLVALELEDAEFVDKGLILTICRSKNDQEGKGRLIGLPLGKHPETCPVRCLKEWIARRGSFAGPLFTRFSRSRFSRSPADQKENPLDAERVGKIVQQCVKRVDLPWREYGSHSLRAGFISEAGNAGLHEWVVASQSGHADMDTLRGYFRRSDVFKGNAAGFLDL